MNKYLKDQIEIVDIRAEKNDRYWYYEDGCNIYEFCLDVGENEEVERDITPKRNFPYGDFDYDALDPNNGMRLVYAALKEEDEV